MTKFLRLRAFVATSALTALAACGSDDPTGPGVTPPTTGSAVLSGTIGANRTLSKDTVYVLRGFVYVANGATLTISAGTKIVGDTTALGSALFVLRGARIVANGSESQPIVFTSQRSAGTRSPGDWGGLVLVGNARNNQTAHIFSKLKLPRNGKFLVKRGYI